MSESGDYEPGPWKGYDFEDARQKYDAHVGRSYDDAVSSDMKFKDLIVPSLVTNSESPLVIACDVTGSMGSWPATIFSKLPYLDLEGKEYLGKGMEICFAAVGDAYTDTYPLQVRPFAAGTDMKKRLEELIIEGNGGGQCMESYELAALYFARNVSMPNAIRPVFIFIGDEGLYEFVNKDHAKKYANIELDSRLATSQIMQELLAKYSVYLIRKPYESSSCNKVSPTDERIYAQWASILGHGRISDLPVPERVVDVIFGILAKETGRIDYFKDELKGRQTAAQVNTVMKALDTMYTDNKKNNDNNNAGHSVMHNRKTGAKSKSLI